MKKRTFIERLCLLLGIVLLVCAIAMLIWWQWNIQNSQQKATEYVQLLSTLMPDTESAFPEPRRNNSMPVLALDGKDFVGILEIPMHDSTLPVCADWGSSHQLPCLFDGSVYDGSIKIGGTSQNGQFAFYRDISVGDSVYFTDTEGRVYSYTVADLRYEKHADHEALERLDADLTLFIKNIYAFEYIIVFCSSQS